MATCAWSAENATKAFLHTLKMASGFGACSISFSIIHLLVFIKATKSRKIQERLLGQYGDVHSLLSHDYQDADFVLIDCKMDDHKQLLQAAQRGLLHKEALLVGCNANHSDPWMADLKAHFLTIGEGLLVTSVPEADKFKDDGKKNRWVVKIDKFTGEEHLYRVISFSDVLAKDHS